MSDFVSFAVKSRIDGLKLSGMYIEPIEQEAKAVIQIVHGMCEHKERYEEVMSYLAKEGYAVFIHDKRGHGASILAKEDLGYMYGGNADAYLEDILQVNEFAKERYPELPMILFGHSMGSLGVRAFTKKYDDKIDALIICGSPSRNPFLGAGQMLVKVQRKLFGGRHVAKLLAKMSIGSFESRFHEEAGKSAWICSNPEVVRAYGEDPLCGFTFTVDAYQVLFELMKRTYDEKEWKLSNIDLPIRFIAGADDPCIVNKEQFIQAVDAMKKAGYNKVSAKLYHGMRHEILNETDREKVYKDLVEYLKKIGM